jgi:uncharacterized protein YndB with AHSA1/START domain
MNESLADRELLLVRLIPASRERVFAAYTQPDLLTRWWAPHPYRVSACEIDLRVGGAFNTTMLGPEGDEHPGQGVFLEIVPDRRVVFTDAFSAGWIPNPNPFIVASIDLEDTEGGTQITATVRHWSVADCERHKAMGFHEGWGKALDQLVETLGNSAA